MALLLRSEELPPMMFVGDVTYGVQRLAADRIPGDGDATGLRDTKRQVNPLAARYPGMPILAAHDPTAESLLATAPRQHGTALA
jgi:N-acyl homoserine lactone hydrolase